MKRTEILRRGNASWVKVSKSKLEFPGARFYLLHSLSHLLMTEVSLDCGYPASSIHERLYCAPHEDANPMAGLLLMTGTNGAEGTLGGLVEEGGRLGRHLKRAWKNAQLCSNDPVCAKHEPTAAMAASSCPSARASASTSSSIAPSSSRPSASRKWPS